MDKYGLYNRWFYWVQTVLPTIYNDALSYYEVVNALVVKIGEIIEQLDGLLEEAVKQANAYTDSKIAEVRAEINQVEADLRTLIQQNYDTLDGKITDLDSKVDANYEDLSGKISDNYNYLLNKINANYAENQQQHLAIIADYEAKIAYAHDRIDKNETDIADLNRELLLKFNELNAKIAHVYLVMAEHHEDLDNRLKQGLEQLKDYIDHQMACSRELPVYNPTNGKLESLQKTLQDMWDGFNIWGITAKEFDSLMITAKDFDNQKNTAWYFDHYYRFYLMERKYLYMLSPFTGKMEPMVDVINRLADLHRKGITAIDFDDLELTATEFDAKMITAYNFDFNGELLLAA